jgi:hypothetical protein
VPSVTRCRPKVHPSSDGEKPSAQPPLHKVDASPSFAIVCVILPFFFPTHALAQLGVGHSRTPIIRRPPYGAIRSNLILQGGVGRSILSGTADVRIATRNAVHSTLAWHRLCLVERRVFVVVVSAFGHVPNFGRLRLAGHLALCLGIRRPAASIHQSNCRIVEVRLHLHSPACKIRLHDQKGRAAGRAACRNHAPGIVEPLLPCIFSCLRGPIANPGASPQAAWCGIGSSMLSVNNRFEILLPFFFASKSPR